MENDAFDAGVKLGGLLNKAQIRLLVCYILANVKSGVKRQLIIETMVEGSIANYFEVGSAIGQLINDKNIKEEEDGSLFLTIDSRKALEEIEMELPFTVREKALEICTKLVVRETNLKENIIETTEIDSGGYYVKCSIPADDDIQMLSFTLFCATHTQADIVKEKFLADPIKIYSSITNALFN